MSKPLIVDRRYVLSGSAAVAAGFALAPLRASAQGKGDAPTGQRAVLELDGSNAVDVAALNPGELVVVATAGTFYGILRRDAAQIAAAAATQADRDPQADAQRVVNEAYLVLDLACTHRGCQVGYTGEADGTFKCPCHRSSFDASGRTLSGPARTNLGIPPYQIAGTVITFT